jgi:hypothetical protein
LEPESEAESPAFTSFYDLPETQAGPYFNLPSTAAATAAAHFYEEAEVDQAELQEVQDALLPPLDGELDQGVEGGGDGEVEGEDPNEIDEELLGHVLGSSLSATPAMPAMPAMPATLRKTPTYAADILALSGNEYVAGLSSINTYARYAHSKSYARDSAADIPTGNSRDPPELFIFHCHTPACSDSTHVEQRFHGHQVSCTPETAQKEKLLPCRYAPICDKTFADKENEQKHYVRTHLWVPVPCPDCLEQNVIYETEGKLSYHRLKEHTDRHNQDLPCPFASICLHEPFQNDIQLRRHLNSVHLKFTNEAKALVPGFNDARREAREKGWTYPLLDSSEQPCEERQWANESPLRGHLVGLHKLSTEAAVEQVPYVRKVASQPEKKTKAPISAPAPAPAPTPATTTTVDELVELPCPSPECPFAQLTSA